jgi:hypothetical protein
MDGLPPGFIKGAVRRADQGHEVKNVVVPLVSLLFHGMISHGVMPEQWKVARISPIYKKGPLLNPNSYRMIAVSSVMYRLYANVVRELMMEWGMRTGKIPESQFGFIPGRDTMQPGFILRHLIHDAQFRCRSERSLNSS